MTLFVCSVVGAHQHRVQRRGSVAHWIGVPVGPVAVAAVVVAAVVVATAVVAAVVAGAVAGVVVVRPEYIFDVVVFSGPVVVGDHGFDF